MIRCYYLPHQRLTQRAVAARLADKYGARVLRRALELAEVAVDPEADP
jgi:hypothetical protein